MNNFKKIARNFLNNKTNLFLSVIFVLFIVLFFTLIKNAFIIVFLIFISWILKFYERYVTLQIGVEFVMFTTILISYSYGPLIGAFSGVAALFLSTSWGGRYTASVFIAFILIVFVSFLVVPLKFLGITTVGIILSILYDIILYFIYMNFLSGRMEKAIIFSVSHSIFNIWAFVVLAPKFIALM